MCGSGRRSSSRGASTRPRHCDRRRTEARAALRATLREDQLKRRETRLLGRGADSRCFGALALPCEVGGRLSIQRSRVQVPSSPPFFPHGYNTQVAGALRNEVPDSPNRSSRSHAHYRRALSGPQCRRSVIGFSSDISRSSDTLGHSSDAAEARRVVQEGHRRGPDEGGQRQPADSRVPGFAVRRASLRAVQECARRRLDPLPSLRDGSTPEPNIRIGPDA
jgi:hypothetical protein